MLTTEPATPTAAEMEQVTKAKLMEDLRTVFVDVEELLKATASQTGERITAARTKAEKSLKAAKARLAEQEGAVMAKTRAVAKATEDYVRINPWKAVGIAAGAGFVLCLLATLLRQPIIEAGEKMIIKGGRAIQVAEKQAQRLFK